jgi:hypothetical protein
VLKNQKILVEKSKAVIIFFAMERLGGSIHLPHEFKSVVPFTQIEVKT